MKNKRITKQLGSMNSAFKTSSNNSLQNRRLQNRRLQNKYC